MEPDSGAHISNPWPETIHRLWTEMGFEDVFVRWSLREKTCPTVCVSFVTMDIPGRGSCTIEVDCNIVAEVSRGGRTEKLVKAMLSARLVIFKHDMADALKRGGGWYGNTLPENDQDKGTTDAPQT